MRETIAILITILLVCGVESFAQGKVTRSTKQTTTSTSRLKKSTPKVTVSGPDGYINGHGYVDLGLPSGTKWATCNIGASSPEESGDYFAWGETKPKSSYTEDNSLTHNKSLSTLIQEGIIDFSNNITPEHDVARVNLGEPWSLPTKDDFEELINKCKWLYLNINGKKGYKVLGQNGNSIFISTTGEIWDISNEGFSLLYGNYWSAQPYEHSYHAYQLTFLIGSDPEVLYSARLAGCPARAVLK